MTRITTGYFADAEKSTTRRTRVHAVDEHERPLCGARVRGEFQWCSHTGDYIECRSCRRALDAAGVNAPSPNEAEPPVFKVYMLTERPGRTTIEELAHHAYTDRARARRAAHRLAKTAALVNRRRIPAEVDPDRYELRGRDLHGPYTLAYVVTDAAEPTLRPVP